MSEPEPWTEFPTWAVQKLAIKTTDPQWRAVFDAAGYTMMGGVGLQYTKYGWLPMAAGLYKFYNAYQGKPMSNYPNEYSWQ